MTFLPLAIRGADVTWTRATVCVSLACLLGLFAASSAAAQGSELLVDPVPGFSGASETVPLTADLFLGVVQTEPDPDRVAELEDAFASGGISGEVRRVEGDGGAVAVLIAIDFAQQADADGYLRGMSTGIDERGMHAIESVPDGVLAFEQTVQGQLVHGAAYKAAASSIVTLAVLADDGEERFRNVLEAQLAHAPIVDATPPALAQEDEPISYRIGYVVGRFLVAALIAYVLVRLVVRVRTGDPDLAREKAKSWRTALLALLILLVVSVPAMT